MAANVNVDFTNTGNDIIAVSYTNANGIAEPVFAVRPQQVIRRQLPINFPFYVTYTRGRTDHSTT
jgi:hypothetical protein